MILAVHVVALPAFGLLRAVPGREIAGGLAFVVAGLALAVPHRLPRRVRTMAATLGLVAASAVLVHLSGGAIEAHFHFFAVVALVTVYHQWAVFGVAVAAIGLHHGVLGSLRPHLVYNHHAAIERPLAWAGIHGTFVVAAALIGIYAWRRNEEAGAAAERLRSRVAEHDRRQRSAVELNDDVVQGLVVARMAVEVGDQEAAAEALDRTIGAARRVVDDLLGESAVVSPGDLVRRRAVSTDAAPEATT